jgi:hypothetical protein
MIAVCRLTAMEACGAAAANKTMIDVRHAGSPQEGAQT